MLVKAGILSWQMMYTHLLYNSAVLFYGHDGMNHVTSIAADDRTAIQSTLHHTIHATCCPSVCIQEPCQIAMSSDSTDTDH